MKTVLNELIDEEQTGFLKNRQILTTIRTSIDISKHTKNLQGYLIISLEFEKCFDKIEYTAIRSF